MTNNILLSVIFLLVTLSGCTKVNPTETDKPDTQALAISILFPINGSEIKLDTTYTIIANTYDNKGISSVDFYIDGNKVGTDNSSPYEYSWNTTGKAGYHSIMAKASDTAGNIGTSATIAVRAISGNMVTVAVGTFTAGSTPVTISSFKMDKYEITYELWTGVRNWALTHGYADTAAGQNGSNPIGTSNPVTMVSWYDVVKWCNARSEKDGLAPVYYTDSAQSSVYRSGQIDINVNAVKWNANGYRLPTEAEWEFAARGANRTHGYTYSGSNIVDSSAWYRSNSGVTTHTVGTKAVNELGIYDMSGNVAEWCWDWWGADYPSGGTIDPKGPSTIQTSRLVRGGSFLLIELQCRVDSRISISPKIGSFHLGFRCVQD